MTGTPCEVPEPRKINENDMRRFDGPTAAFLSKLFCTRHRHRLQPISLDGSHSYFRFVTPAVPDKILLPNDTITAKFSANNFAVLTTLRIKNLALVADLTLELQAGYNAITGETGAGKSILIGALNLVLGERADRTLIRSGSDTCSVEAVFDVSQLRAPLKKFLDEHGLEPCQARQLLLKRTLAANGMNRQFINGSPTTLNVLATLGEWLVDIHGPHDHQSLLHSARQLAILDAFGGLDSVRESLADLVRRRRALEEEKASLIVDERTYAQQLDLLRHQAAEIAAA